MDIAHYAAVSIVISFLVSGHRSVFPSQKIQMSKSDLLEIEFGEDIEHSRVKFDKAQYKRFNKIYHDIQLKRLRHRQDRLKRRKKSEEEEENEGEGVKSEED